MTAVDLKSSEGRRDRSEKGAVLVWVAGSLVVLLAMAAFAVDLGWFYLNRSRLQSAADAAALAGVVNLPGFPADADADAASAAASNGFSIAGVTAMDTTVHGDNQFEVELTTTVDTFFLKVLGIETVDISRRAMAEYIKPVALGSPSNQFGGPGQNFWAAINGRYTEMQQGDPYASQCITHAASSPGCSGGTNPLYRPGGYYYAVEVAPGSSGLNIQIYDGGHYLEESGSPVRGGYSTPSDTSWRWNWPSGQRGVNIEMRLYEPDQTPLNPTDNPTLRCTRTFPTYADESLSGTQINNGHFNQWTGNNNCSISGSVTPGIWVLQFPSPLYEGSSKFAIRASTTSGPAPKVYGLLDMSIHVNFSSGVAEPYLAEVRPEHAGRTLEIDIFDLGEFNGGGRIWFLKPDGTKPQCNWTSSNGEQSAGYPSLITCDESIADQRFNEDWINLDIEIPDTYTCDTSTATGCWWKIHIQAPGSTPTDRTTWSARITGDPVRLTE